MVIVANLLLNEKITKVWLNFTGRLAIHLLNLIQLLDRVSDTFFYLCRLQFIMVDGSDHLPVQKLFIFCSFCAAILFDASNGKLDHTNFYRLAQTAAQINRWLTDASLNQNQSRPFSRSSGLHQICRSPQRAN